MHENIRNATDGDYAKPFEYVIPWKSSSLQLGSHRGTQRGIGAEYRGNVNLVDYPDARRMDIRQTIRDPLEQVQVRQFNQDSTTPIYILCDLTSSMQFKGPYRKLDKAIEISTSIANSANLAGDVFSFIGYNDNVLEDYTLPLSRNVHQAKQAIAMVSSYNKMGTGHAGLDHLPDYLGTHKGLVFWISDFHLPLITIDKTLVALSAHKVIPIVLWDDNEYKKLPKFGFGTLKDPETGLNRTLFFRKDLNEKIQAVFSKRKEALDSLFLKHDCPGVFIMDAYKPEIMTNYFEQNMNL